MNGFVWGLVYIVFAVGAIAGAWAAYDWFVWDDKENSMTLPMVLMGAVCAILLGIGLAHNIGTSDDFTSATVFSKAVQNGTVEKVVYTPKPSRRRLYGNGDEPVQYFFVYEGGRIPLEEANFVAYVTGKEFVKGKDKTTVMPMPIPIAVGR